MRMMLRRRLLMAVGVALLAALWLPTAALATTFSFGTVAATDIISSLTFAPSATKTSYNPVSQVMHVESYLSQINFSNRPNITGIAPNSVLFTSDIMLVPGTLVVTDTTLTSNNPLNFVSGFMNGELLDLSILDTLGGLSLLDADYVGNLSFTGRETIAAVNGELSGDLSILTSGDADFRSAFGTLGRLQANFSGFQSGGVSVGTNLCNLVKDDGIGGGTWPTVCGPGYGLDDFTVNANMTITPTVIPEPGTALLLGLGLAGVAALRRK